jgi:hypothetical protein
MNVSLAIQLFSLFKNIVECEDNLALGGFPALVAQGILPEGDRKTNDLDISLFTDNINDSEQFIQICNRLHRYRDIINMHLESLRVNRRMSVIIKTFSKSGGTFNPDGGLENVIDIQAIAEQSRALKSNVGVDSSYSIMISFSPHREFEYFPLSTFSDMVDSFNHRLSRTYEREILKSLTISPGKWYANSLEHINIVCSNISNIASPLFFNIEMKKSVENFIVEKMNFLSERFSLIDTLFLNNINELKVDLFVIGKRSREKFTKTIDGTTFVRPYPILKAKYEYCRNINSSDDAFLKHINDLKSSYSIIKMKGINDPPTIDKLSLARDAQKESLEIKKLTKQNNEEIKIQNISPSYSISSDLYDRLNVIWSHSFTEHPSAHGILSQIRSNSPASAGRGNVNINE